MNNHHISPVLRGSPGARTSGAVTFYWRPLPLRQRAIEVPIVQLPATASCSGTDADCHPTGLGIINSAGKTGYLEGIGAVTRGFDS